MAKSNFTKTSDAPERHSVSRESDTPARDRTKAELLDSLKTSMEQVQAGNHRPALEVLDELDGEMSEDADLS